MLSESDKQYEKRRSAKLKANGVCKVCRGPVHDGQTRCGVCRIKECERTKAKKRLLKDEIYAAYGGYVCACCGETEPLFLTLDHINENGAEHRRQIGGGQGNGSSKMHHWLKRNCFPAGFQILCQNCNVGKHRNGGVCPHKRDK